jgi:hypothetical protein
METIPNNTPITCFALMFSPNNQTPHPKTSTMTAMAVAGAILLKGKNFKT